MFKKPGLYKWKGTTKDTLGCEFHYTVYQQLDYILNEKQELVKDDCRTYVADFGNNHIIEANTLKDLQIKVSLK